MSIRPPSRADHYRDPAAMRKYRQEWRRHERALWRFNTMHQVKLWSTAVLILVLLLGLGSVALKVLR